MYWMDQIRLIKSRGAQGTKSDQSTSVSREVLEEKKWTAALMLLVHVKTTLMLWIFNLKFLRLPNQLYQVLPILIDVCSPTATCSRSPPGKFLCWFILANLILQRICLRLALFCAHRLSAHGCHGVRSFVVGSWHKIIPMASQDAGLLAQANYEDALDNFLFKVEFVWITACRDNGCNIAVVIWRTQFSYLEKKGVMEEVNIKPVGSQHILYSLQRFLLLCMWRFCFHISYSWWGSVEVQGDLFSARYYNI